MLQLENTSPFPATLAVLPDAEGVDTLYISLKATFTLDPKPAIAEKQHPIVLADEFWGEPGRSSLRYASEVHLPKPSTDIALNGSARAPGGKRTTQVDVSLAVGPHRKTVRVLGDREWRPGFWFFPDRMTSPAPFESMPLLYERAFGGVHEIAGKKAEVRFEPRNPVGRGFAGKRKGRELAGLKLPNLEDPSQPIRSPRHARIPAGFGFVAASWEPRKSFAGTYDDRWQKQRAPYLPDDFDPRFFNAAHPDLVAPRHLSGGEVVEVTNASVSGTLRFEVPTVRLAATVRIAGRDEKPPLLLETLLIEPDEKRFSMLWRGAVSCDKRALQIERVRIALESMGTNGGSR